MVKNPFFYKRKDGSFRTNEEAREYMEKILPPTPPPIGNGKEMLKKLATGGTVSENDMIVKQGREIERLNNIINELEKDIENQIIFCTNEANGTTDDKYCRIAINYLKHLKDKLQELKGGNRE